MRLQLLRIELQIRLSWMCSCLCSDPAWMKPQQRTVLGPFVSLSIPLRPAHFLTVCPEREARHTSFNQEHSRGEQMMRWEYIPFEGWKKIRQPDYYAQQTLPFPLYLSLKHTHKQAKFIPHTDGRRTASMGTTCKYVWWPSEPCGEERTRQAWFHNDKD